MNFDKRKISAAQKLLATEEEDVLERIEYLLSTEEQVKISIEQKRILDEALASIEDDGRIPHKQVVRETDQRYKKNELE